MCGGGWGRGWGGGRLRKSGVVDVCEGWSGRDSLVGYQRERGLKICGEWCQMNPGRDGYILQCKECQRTAGARTVTGYNTIFLVFFEAATIGSPVFV